MIGPHGRAPMPAPRHARPPLPLLSARMDSAPSIRPNGFPPRRPPPMPGRAEFGRAPRTCPRLTDSHAIAQGDGPPPAIAPAGVRHGPPRFAPRHAPA